MTSGLALAPGLILESSTKSSEFFILFRVLCFARESITDPSLTVVAV